jgi:hypothetical protein
VASKFGDYPEAKGDGRTATNPFALVAGAEADIYGGIGVFQPKTWADGDEFTRFGGRRGVHICGGTYERIRL